MNDFARFWAVDLHVHTPGSSDARVEDYGTAGDIVAAAIQAGLDAIAITDHNTSAWCERVATAAVGTNLVVLPGVEISTAEGHLLAIFDQGTNSSVIDEMLVRLGIGQADQGKLDIAAKVGIKDAAGQVAAAGGLAIAAHVEKPRGLLRLEVAAHLKDTLLEEDLAAIEVVHLDTRALVNAKLAGERTPAYVRGSDTWDPARSRHALSGIGSRRTWIKAGRPDLRGIAHAFADPDLRISLEPIPNDNPYPAIEVIEVAGGFLDGQMLTFCPDLTCLLGGTGAGKSLVLEAIRYALDQQVDRRAFPAIWEEVRSRLSSALGETGVVRLQFCVEGQRYRVERVFALDGSATPAVFQQAGDDWVPVDAAPDSLITIAAFSQGEVLEYSRQPVGRMSLVDAGIDLSSVESELDGVRQQLLTNAKHLVDKRRRVDSLRLLAAREASLDSQVSELASLFDAEIVKQQEAWQAEHSVLDATTEQIARLVAPKLQLPRISRSMAIEANNDLFSRIDQQAIAAQAALDKASEDLAAALISATSGLEALHAEWSQRFASFKNELDKRLEEINPGSSLSSLRGRLESLQTRLIEARASKDELQQEALPGLAFIESEREALLASLQALRRRRRELRRARVAELNKKAAGFVKLDVPNGGDSSLFRAALDRLKVGSRVKEDVLDSLARNVHPVQFVRALLSNDLNSIIDPGSRVDAASVGRLLANIDDRDLWSELLEVQAVDLPDTLSVKFRKLDCQSYAPIESLAHGQKCTAILVILLADGTTPVLVDQPEDALHAPWIEEYLVDRLRSLRGTRQYIFATRSPGIVVSADAEQIITMCATAGRGEVEACGSLERHDLNRLALLHLEGGPVAFKRRTRKLLMSTQSAT